MTKTKKAIAKKIEMPDGDFWVFNEDKKAGAMLYSALQSYLELEGDFSGVSSDPEGVAYTCIVAATPLGGVHLSVTTVALVCGRTEAVVREHLAVAEGCGVLIRKSGRAGFPLSDSLDLMRVDDSHSPLTGALFGLVEKSREFLYDWEDGDDTNFPLALVASARNHALRKVNDPIDEPESDDADRLLLKVLDHALEGLLAHAQWAGG